jgi:hypothetical protein
MGVYRGLEQTEHSRHKASCPGDTGVGNGKNNNGVKPCLISELLIIYGNRWFNVFLVKNHDLISQKLNIIIHIPAQPSRLQTKKESQKSELPSVNVGNNTQI